MPVPNQWVAAAATVNLLTTELNSLASGASVVSSVGGSSGVYNNVVGGTTNLAGYTAGRLVLTLAAPAGTLTANSAFSIWFLKSIDGSTFEDGSASITPARPADVLIPVRNVSTAQLIEIDTPLPFGQHKILFQNNVGQALNAANNTLVVLAATEEGVPI